VLSTSANAGVRYMNQGTSIKQLLLNSWYKVLASFSWPPYQADRFIYSSTGERAQGSRCPQSKGEVCHLGKACRDQRIEVLLQKLCSRQASYFHLQGVLPGYSVLRTHRLEFFTALFLFPGNPFFLGVLTELWGKVLSSIL